MNQEEFDKSDEPGFWEMSYVKDNPECKHKLPGDWIFGGATDEDPRTDPRWRPMTYVFMDRFMRARHMTSEPFCIHDAIGWHRQRFTAWSGTEIFYVIASIDGSKGELVYNDMEGALSAAG